MKFFIFILTFHSFFLFSNEYTITDRLEKDHFGRIDRIKRVLQMNSEELLHREKAKMILYKELNNIFQFWDGYASIYIQGVGKIDYVTEQGKYARKYSEKAVLYSLSKEFSRLYFYDNELNSAIEASNLFPEFKKDVNNTFQFSEADLKLKEAIKDSYLKEEERARISREQHEKRKIKQEF